MKVAWALLAGVLVGSCRTQLKPLVRNAATPRVARESGECSVHDYPSATDVGAGATNVGWVSVPREGSDDETFNRLRAAVCAKGGNAFSQAHWIRPPGASVADPPAELEANAWAEPR